MQLSRPVNVCKFPAIKSNHFYVIIFCVVFFAPSGNTCINQNPGGKPPFLLVRMYRRRRGRTDMPAIGRIASPESGMIRQIDMRSILLLIHFFIYLKA